MSVPPCRHFHVSLSTATLPDASNPPPPHTLTLLSSGHLLHLAVSSAINTTGNFISDVIVTQRRFGKKKALAHEALTLEAIAQGDKSHSFAKTISLRWGSVRRSLMQWLKLHTRVAALSPAALGYDAVEVKD